MGKAAVRALPALVMALGFACRPQPKVADWVRSAPPASRAAVSGQVGWLLRNAQFRDLLAQQPMAEQALDLFISKARIDPARETGRLTLHILDTPLDGHPAPKGFLLQLDQFQDPKGLLNALVAAFPPEGTLRLENRECPLFVLMDVDTGQIKAHLRAVADRDGRIWIGDVEALARLSSDSGRREDKDLLAAAAWISPDDTLQGFLHPDSLLSDLKGRLPDSFAKELPQGIQVLAWGATPGADDTQPCLFELSLSGTPEGVSQALPWIQRLAAAVGAVQHNSSQPPPEVHSERTRAGLRMSLTMEQLKQMMEKLGQPFASRDPEPKKS